MPLENSLEIPTHFNFPFEVLMFMCCMSHMVIVLVGFISTAFGLVFDFTTPMKDLVKACAIILIMLNTVFFMVTLKFTISVANTTDQHTLISALNVYYASIQFLGIETFMIVPYVIYRVETVRRWWIAVFKRK